MTTQYTEGAARALVRDDTAVLLPGPPARDVVDRVWDALDAPPQGGVVAVVGALTQAAGGLVDVPPFAVAESDSSAGPGAGTVRVAVRGATAAVTVHTGSGPVVISGSGVLMWAERVVEDAVAVELVVNEPGDGSSSAGTWPLLGGVVRARAVRRVLDPARAGGATDAAADPAPVDSAPVDSARVGSARVDSASAGPAVPGDPVATVTEMPAPGTPVVEVPGAGVPVASADPTAGPIAAPDDEVPSQETLLDAPEDGTDGPAASSGQEVPNGPDASSASDAPVETAGSERPAAAALAADSASDRSDDSASDSAADSASDRADGAPPAGPGPHDGYEHLFGETVFRQIEEAAVRAVDEQEGADESDAKGGPGSSSPGAEPGVISGVPADVVAPVSAGSSTPAVEEQPPAATPGPEPVPVVAPGPGEVDDHDGQTIMTSELAALRAAAAASAPQFATPAPAGAGEVLALTCRAGHPNPPTRDACRTCGVALEGDPATAPRPALGRALVATASPDGGQSVELDRDVVVGRRPRTSTTSADRMPRMVTVPSPQKDVSRSHLQVTLEEWHVLVEDLATTNGTVLMRAGQQPRRLHPHQKEIIVDGDVLDLGDGVTVMFEGIW